MEQLIPLLVQLVSGAVGGNAAGAAMKKFDLSAAVRTIAGALGGVGGGQLAMVLGVLEAIFGNAAGTTGGAIAGNAGAGVIGGAVVTAIVGLIKQAMANKT